jgi:hypothetical protein
MNKVVSFVDTTYLKNRVCSMTHEQLVDKAFKVKDWMELNFDNEWVQQVGKTIIHKLNSTYTVEDGFIK